MPLRADPGSGCCAGARVLGLTRIGEVRLIAVDPLSPPLDTVETARTTHAALVEAAVVAAWTAHHGEVYAFLVRTTRSVEVAEDLLAETFLRLTIESRAGRSPENTRAWLYRVAANLAVSRGRRLSAAIRGIARFQKTDAPTATSFTPEASYLQREGRADLVAALADLAPDARAALLLSSEGFSGLEIAAAIGRSDAATRTLLSRTRVRVRQRLEAAGATR